MGLKATNHGARCVAVSFGMLLTTLSALPSTVAAQAKRYGDVSYAQPSDCSLITRMNTYNPYAYLIRDHCEQSDARLRQKKVSGTILQGIGQE